jgi:hypothetical protein
VHLTHLLFLNENFSCLKILFSIGNINAGLYTPLYQEKMLLALFPKGTRARGKKRKNARDMTNS